MRLIHPLETKPLRLWLSVATLSSATLRFGERTESRMHLPQDVLLIGSPSSNNRSLAREIHITGVRRDKPFLRLACDSLPTGNQFDSLMFGGLSDISAESPSTAGTLRSASGGSIFLDDVHLLANQSQQELFAGLDAQQVVPLGASEPVAIDVRTLASVDAFLMDGEIDECVLVRIPVCVLAACSAWTKKRG